MKVVSKKDYMEYMQKLDRDGIKYQDSTVFGFSTIRMVFGGWNVSKNISKCYIFDENRAVKWAEDIIAHGGSEAYQELARDIIQYVGGAK